MRRFNPPPPQRAGTVAKRVAAERRGRLAEALCVLRLRLTGWRILARRLKAKRGTGLGEVDIVARRGATVAFIEVKARRDLAAATDSISILQRGRIARSANAFMHRHPEYGTCDVRFDVMIVGNNLLPHVIVDAWRPGFP